MLKVSFLTFHRLQSKINAFTLAEILITLGIIGIVAAMTIPTLINNANNLSYEAGFKKAFSILAQSSSLLKSDTGGSLVGLYNNADEAIDALCTRLKCTTICHSTDDRKACFRDSNWKMLDGRNGWMNYSTEPGHVSANISDGMQLDTWWSTNCSMPNGMDNNVCSEIVVDVNGSKMPNKMGRDMFYFMLTQDKFIPMGTDDTGYKYSLYPQNCDPKLTTGTYNGYVCAARILQDGGIKY